MLQKKPTSSIYFENLFENTTLAWNKIYLSLRLATIDTTLRSFNIKFLIMYFVLTKTHRLLELQILLFALFVIL